MRAGKSKAIENDIDAGLKSLLDHIAEELAEEYVRLMEQAADEQLALSAAPATTDEEGDSL